MIMMISPEINAALLVAVESLSIAEHKASDEMMKIGIPAIPKFAMNSAQIFAAIPPEMSEKKAL